MKRCFSYSKHAKRIGAARFMGMLGKTPLSSKDKSEYLQAKIEGIKQSILRGDYETKTISQIASFRGIEVSILETEGLTDEFILFCSCKPNPQLSAVVLASVWGVSFLTANKWKSFQLKGLTVAFSAKREKLILEEKQRAFNKECSLDIDKVI